MKILFVTTGLSRAGAEVMLLNILSRMDRSQFDPVVISLMGKGALGEEVENLGVPLYCAGMSERRPTLKSVFKLVKIARRLDPELIQGWMYHGNLASQFLNLFLKRKVKVLWSIHHSLHNLSAEKFMTRLIIRLGSWSSRYVHQVAYVSEKSRSQHHAVGYLESNSCLIPNGFDTEKFRPCINAKFDFRDELKLLRETFVIGTAARYHPMKDHPNFIRAAKILLGVYPNVKFVMVGHHIDSENDELTDLIESLGIENSVYLLGLRSDMPRITPALDILSTSSAYGEAFPMVVGEAMSCGVPCVVTDIGDSGWIVGPTGGVVPPGDSAALAAQWQNIIAMDTVERKQLSEAARNRIKNKFALRDIVDQYNNMYLDAISD